MMKRFAKASGKAKAPPKPAEQTEASEPDTGIGGVPLPSSNPVTNFLIADIVLRAAGDLVRERVERGMISTTYDEDKVDELVDSSGLFSTIALYGVSRLATRSPAGLALVAGGLLLKTLYDRGRNLEKRRGGQPKRRSRLRLPGRKN